MTSSDSAMFSIWRVTTVLWLISQLSRRSFAYELHDTIHTLKEENLHLHHRLENLTWALRDLEYLLTEHSKISGTDTEFLQVWREWSQHGISAETHQTLKEALCLTELHGAAQHIFITQGFLLILLPPFVSMILLLLS